MSSCTVYAFEAVGDPGHLKFGGTTASWLDRFRNQPRGNPRKLRMLGAWDVIDHLPTPSVTFRKIEGAFASKVRKSGVLPSNREWYEASLSDVESCLNALERNESFRRLHRISGLISFTKLDVSEAVKLPPSRMVEDLNPGTRGRKKIFQLRLNLIVEAGAEQFVRIHPTAYGAQTIAGAYHTANRRSPYLYKRWVGVDNSVVEQCFERVSSELQDAHVQYGWYEMPKEDASEAIQRLCPELVEDPHDFDTDEDQGRVGLAPAAHGEPQWLRIHLPRGSITSG